MKGQVDLGNWLHTKMVHPNTEGQPSNCGGLHSFEYFLPVLLLHYYTVTICYNNYVTICYNIT